MVRASVKPRSLNALSTAASAFGSQATSSPPLVCGSESSLRIQSGAPAGPEVAVPDAVKSALQGQPDDEYELSDGSTWVVGSYEELKELAVLPTISPEGVTVVITVTPVAKVPRAERKALALKLSDMAPIKPICARGSRRVCAS